ncbi:MAG: hypothetical protein APF80_02545 [Alphaproteobacteria bacterium BRH_c36]|nr:MAG: hypothetical protein APF80_02545 [Alphaproteobacteria bacterium BRH_c36]
MANVIENTKRNVESEAAKQDVKENYESLRGDVAELASSVKKLADTELGGALSSAKETAEKNIGQIEKSIRKNPTQAALVAAGIGFVVGLVLTR